MRLLLLWILNAVALLAVTWLLPSIQVSGFGTALIAALDEGRIAGAGLDVYTHEPAVDPRLFALSNVVLLPHMGSATFEGRDATGARVIANIRSWVDGHRPPNQVLEGWV